MTRQRIIIIIYLVCFQFTRRFKRLYSCTQPMIIHAVTRYTNLGLTQAWTGYTHPGLAQAWTGSADLVQLDQLHSRSQLEASH